MFAFVFVQTEGHMVAGGLMLWATLLAAAVVAGVYVYRAGVALARELAAWRRGESTFAIEIEHGDKRWRKVLGAALVAFAVNVAVIRADSFPVSNPCHGVEDWALWILLGCWMQ
jgi:hypothetical protein